MTEKILTDQWVLIWIQPVWHYDSIPKQIFKKANFEKKSADDNKSMKNYPACKDFSLEPAEKVATVAGNQTNLCNIQAVILFGIWEASFSFTFVKIYHKN